MWKGNEKSFEPGSPSLLLRSSSCIVRAQHSSHMKKNESIARGALVPARSIQGVSAAPRTMWRELMSQVVMTITRKDGAALQSATAANSLPPA